MKINDNGVDRDMTEAEEKSFKDWQKILLAEDKADKDLKIAKNDARNALLEKLGITTEEAALLLS
jgi:hypothetical protein